MKNDAVYRCKSVHNMAFEELYRNDKDFIHLPRHSSFTIMQDFAKLGRVRHNMSGNRINTTVWTTKAHKQNRDKGKCVGRIP